jgi:hypothetical protein
LQSLARDRFEEVSLSKEAWSTDPQVNAFFATAEDVRTCLGNSTELREFFEQNAALNEAYALLGMKKEERQVFAPDTSGDRVVKDVARVTVCFSEHTVIAPSSTVEGTRVETGKRIIRRLAEAALARISESSAAASELQARKAHLGARLRQLELARTGIVGSSADIASQIATVKRELAGIAEEYADAKADAGTLDAYIQHIDDVFSHPEQHVATVHTPLRLDKQGFKVESGARGPVNELVLAEIVVTAELHAAIAIVRCNRAELPEKRDFFATAARYL